jgi:hypothetical protein
MKARKAEDKKVTSDEKYKKQIEALDNQIELKSKMKKVLNPEQMKKWEEKQNYRKEMIGKAKRKAKENKE